MKLTDDGHAFIARWLLEFGSEPVSFEKRIKNEWYQRRRAYGHLLTWHIEQFTVAIRPEALAAFKGEQNE